MVPPDQAPDKEKKIQNIEQELNDLRQGLAIVTDYYRDLKDLTLHQEAIAGIDTIVKPLVNDDLEFEGIWKFHEELLTGDPQAIVSREDMFNAFAAFCRDSGRTLVEQEAFEFVFARMENPHPVLDRGSWNGCRLKDTTRTE